jgi:hypothetical protein
VRPSFFSVLSILAVIAISKTGATKPCDQDLLRKIPVRSAVAPSGSDFARQVGPLSESEREAALEAQLLDGDVPVFLRRLLPVRLGARLPDGRQIAVTVCVLPDYLALGSDDDFLLVPMRLATALAVAGRFGFTLPTARMVDAIYEQAAARLVPQPLPAGDRMRTTEYYWRHTEIVRAQEQALGVLPGTLTAGDKKDLVLTNRLWQNLERVAIYGWHRPDHSPIQPLSTVHGARYADYSHGVRLVSAVVYVEDEPMPLLQALGDDELAPALSGEGPIRDAAQLVAMLADQGSDLQQRNPK